MDRLLFILVPLLVAAGMLAFAAYQNSRDGEQIAGVAVLLIIAVPVGIFGYRLSQKQSDR